METRFDVHGVLQIAEKVEHNGTQFYLRAAERFIDPKCSDLCRELATWRAGEERILLGRRKRRIPRHAAPSLTAEQRDYILTNPAVMADLEAFAHSTGKGIRLTGRERINDILRIAIARAEDAIAFYRGLKAFVHDDAGIEALDMIIQEEKIHIRALTDKLSSHESPAPQAATET